MEEATINGPSRRKPAPGRTLQLVLRIVSVSKGLFPRDKIFLFSFLPFWLVAIGWHVVIFQVAKINAHFLVN